jgi:arylformamidase
LTILACKEIKPPNDKKTTMEVIDLSQLLTNQMPVFPGSESVDIHSISEIETGGFNELHLHISGHTGTHIDCGRHMINDGWSLSTTAPGKFFGKGLIIPCHLDDGGVINRDFLLQYGEQIVKVDFVLFKTGWSKFWSTKRYFSGFPVPDIEAANYLAQFNLKGIGIDTPGFDPVDSNDYPVHVCLLSKQIILIENLTNLNNVPVGDFLFSCLPLKIKDGDGSPVRAVAIVG